MRIHKPNEISIPNDLDQTYVILQGSALWHASKNRNYRASITSFLSSVHEFLLANNLYVANDVVFSDSASFELRRDQVTGHGFRFLWMYLDGYMHHLDRTGRVSNSDYLDSCFRQFEKTI